MVDSVLAELDPVFEGMYATVGRSSGSPRRALCERLNQDLLCTWWDHRARAAVGERDLMRLQGGDHVSALAPNGEERAVRYARLVHASPSILERRLDGVAELPDSDGAVTVVPRVGEFPQLDESLQRLD